MPKPFSSSCHFFRRAVCFLLALALLVPDPLWASGIQASFKSLSLVSSNVFLSEALNLNPVAGQWWGTLKRAIVFCAVINLLPGSVFAEQRSRGNPRPQPPPEGVEVALPEIPKPAPVQQPPQKPKKEKRPPVERSVLPQAPAIELQNVRLVEANLAKAYRAEADLSQVSRFEGLLPQILSGNPALAAQFLSHRESWQSLLAARQSEGKYFQLRDREVGVAFLGDQSRIRQVLSFPGVAVSQPKRQLQMADPIAGPDRGFLFWRTLLRYVQGGDVYSKNQVELSFLAERGDLFDVRARYAEREEFVFDLLETAVHPWLNYVTKDQQQLGWRRAIYINERTENRERQALALEGGRPEGLERLRRASEASHNALSDVRSQLNAAHTQLISVVAGSEMDFARPEVRALRPVGTVLSVTPEILALSRTIPSLLEQEGTPHAIETPTTMPSREDFVDALSELRRVSVESINPPSEDPVQVMNEDDLKAVFTPIPADLPLGTSPRERRLLLAKMAIDEVDVPSLLIKKERQTRWGFGFDPGKVFWGLFRLAVSQPDDATKRSLDMEVAARELKKDAIDQQIEAERVRMRTRWMAARSQRQDAWAKMVIVNNQMVAYFTEWQRALKVTSPYVPADKVTPYLQIERLSAEFALHVWEARAARRVMDLYTPEGQAQIQQATIDHYLRVLQRVAPETNPQLDQVNPPTAPSPKPSATVPVAKSGKARFFQGVRAIAPVLLAIAGSLVPWVAHAHTFSQVAVQTAQQTLEGSTAAKMALQVTFGQHTGGSSNTLWGVSVDMLKALHPEQARFTENEIWNMIHQIAEKGGISKSSFLVRADHTYDIGSFDADVVQRLQAQGSAVTVTPIPTPIDAPAAAVPEEGFLSPSPAIESGIPTSQPEVASSGSIDAPGLDMGHSGSAYASDAFHQAMTWVQDPWHAAALIGLMVLGGALWIIFRGSSWKTNLPAPRVTWRRRAIGSVVGAMALAIMVSAAQPLKAQVSRWWAASPAPSAQMSQETSTQNPTTRDQLWGQLKKWFSWESSNKKESFPGDNGTPHVGVGQYPVRMEVTWAAPPGEGGSVVAVRRDKRSFNKGDLLIGYGALDEYLQSRLRSVSGRLTEVFGKGRSPLSAERVQRAFAEPTHALIQVRTDPETSSVDQRIREAVIAIEMFLDQHHADLTQLQNIGHATGAPVTESFSLVSLRNELMRRTAELNARLLERTLRNRSAVQAFEIDSDNPIIPVGANLPAGESKVLFTQALPDHRLVQLRMGLEDLAALGRHWRSAPASSGLRLALSSGDVLNIPLTDLIQPVLDDDPLFKSRPIAENFLGFDQTNVIVGGIEGQQTIYLVVRSQALANVRDTRQVRFRGIFSGSTLVRMPLRGLTVGTVSLARPLPTPVQRPHIFMLPSLRDQLTALNELIQNERALRQEIQLHQQKFPEREWAPMKLLELDQRIQRLSSEANGLKQWIARLEESARLATAWTVQPVSPLLNGHYPLGMDLPTRSEAENLHVLGPTVKLSVTFYADSNTLPDTGGLIGVMLESQPTPTEFTIVGRTATDKSRSYFKYTAERSVPLSEARRLFPSGQPLVQGYVEIDAMRGRAPSQLKFTELLMGLRSPVVLSFLSLGLVGEWNTGWYLAGYGLAIAIHEAGHYVRARNVGFDRLRLGWTWGEGWRAWNTWALEWKHPNQAGVWTTLHSWPARVAGPWTSAWAMKIGFGLLAVWSAILLMWNLEIPGVAPLLFAFVWASRDWRQADHSQPPLATSGIFKPKVYDIQEMLPEAPEENPLPLMSENSLESLRDVMKSTAFEEEMFVTEADPSTLLTWPHTILRFVSNSLNWVLRSVRLDVLRVRLHPKRVRLVPHMMIYQKWERREVSQWLAFVNSRRFKLQGKEPAASGKTRTFEFVLLIIAGLGILYFWGPVYFREAVNRVALTGFGYIRDPLNEYLTLLNDPNPVAVARRRVILGFVVFLGGWVVIASAEAWGKLFATIFLNIEKLLWFFYDIPYRSKKKFLTLTKHSAREEWEKATNKGVLYPDSRPYARFQNQYRTFTKQLANRGYRRLRRLGPASDEAMAFENGLRIQLRRSRSSLRSPIYSQMPAEVPSDAALIAHIKKGDPEFDPLKSPESYQRLMVARSEAAIQLMRKVPRHTIVAMLRSGTAEVVGGVHEMPGPEIIQEILELLKERTPSVDESAVGSVRAQEKRDDLFELLDYIYEGLRIAVLEKDEPLRRYILNFLTPAVDNFEYSIWQEILFGSELDRLMMETDKTREQIDSDQGNILMIMYVIALRTLKEKESQAQGFLDGLKDHLLKERTPVDVMSRRYLRGFNATTGTYRPTTSALQLNTAYEKYYDLLRQFIEWFPDAYILDSLKVWVTCENAVNFRQLYREIIFWQRLTRGSVTVTDVGGTHPAFFQVVKKLIRARLPGWYRIPLLNQFLQVRFKTIDRIDRDDVLGRDTRTAVIFSATPGDALALNASVGTILQVPSEFFSPAAIVGLIMHLKKKDFDTLVETKRKELEQKREKVGRPLQELFNQLKQDAPLSQAGASFLSEDPRGNALQRLLAKAQTGLPITYKDKVEVTALRAAFDQRESQLHDIDVQLNDLDRMQREFHAVELYLKTLGIPVEQLNYGQDLPMVPGDEASIFKGDYDLAYFTRSAKRPDQDRVATHRAKSYTISKVASTTIGLVLTMTALASWWTSETPTAMTMDLLGTSPIALLVAGIVFAIQRWMPVRQRMVLILRAA